MKTLCRRRRKSARAIQSTASRVGMPYVNSAAVSMLRRRGGTMSKYAGTQTEKNLAAAFAGESQATNKYTYFASVAKKEGFEQIAEIFRKTSANEQYLSLIHI